MVSDEQHRALLKAYLGLVWNDDRVSDDQAASVLTMIRQQQRLASKLRRRAAALYFDDSYPERNCDYCGCLYRGPAVYCCLAHAVADASGTN